MYRFRHVALAVMTLVAALACASGGESVASLQAHVTRSIGTAPRGEIDNHTKQMLQREQYVLLREENETNLYYESQWRPRQPFEDERAAGVREAESRLIVRARPRNRAQDNYSVTLVVENRARVADSANWELVPATEQFEKYVDAIAARLKTELVDGIRIRGQP